MPINAYIQPIIEENFKEDPLYRSLEIYMQRLGYLVTYREKLNWTDKIDVFTIGDEGELKELKKLAAKNDRTLLFYAKLTKKTVYQHVICHPNDSGIYLPFHFERPFTLSNNQKPLWFGSAPKLLQELKWLEISLKNNGDDSLFAYWDQFQQAAHLAIDSMSPMLLKKED